MSIKGKAKIVAIAIFKVIALIPLVLLAFILLTSRAIKNDVLPEVIDAASYDLREIKFNVKKLF